MYTEEGLRSGTSVVSTKIIPWDRVRPVRFGNGARAIRHTLLLREEHFPLYLYATGLGGIRRTDVGRTLVVDRLPDGRWVDYLEG